MLNKGEAQNSPCNKNKASTPLFLLHGPYGFFSTVGSDFVEGDAGKQFAETVGTFLELPLDHLAHEEG